MVEAGASRDDEEEGHSNKPHLEDSRDTEHDASQSRVDIMDEVCPITDKNEKPFRLMDLPPEIRIEIYRACLTRPFDVLLSREPKAAEAEKERAHARESREPIDELTPDLLDQIDDEVERMSPRDETSSPTRRVYRMQSRMRALRSNFARDRNDGNNNNNNSNTTPGDPVTPQPNATNATTDNSNPPDPGPRITRGRRATTIATTAALPPRAPRPQDVDPLLVKILSTSKLVYKEARSILYGENNFMLDLDTAQHTLAALHQRSRGQIKTLRVIIPTHNEILERFAEVVRLSLRYCWRLKRFIIYMPFILPGAEGSSTSGNTTVYANAFDILRWLPRQCEVVLEGNVCEEIRRVVEKNSNLAKSLDEVSYSSYVHEGTPPKSCT